jgi:hypothetical protein
MSIVEIPPQPTEDCPICASPQRAAGAAMVKCGASLQEVATALQVAVDDVQTHFAEHSPIPISNIDPHSASDNELAQLLHDSTELYLQSVLQNSLVSASSALSVRLRCVSEMGEREVKREKHQGELLAVDPEDCSTWSSELANWIMRYQDGILRRMAEVENRNEVEA